jgi:hypothetical protein
MLGIDMIFKAIGMDDAAIAELKTLLDPAKLKVALKLAQDRWEALETDVREMRAELAELRLVQEEIRNRTMMSELVSHGAQVLHPNFQRHLDKQLAAQLIGELNDDNDCGNLIANGTDASGGNG